MCNKVVWSHSILLCGEQPESHFSLKVLTSALLVSFTFWEQPWILWPILLNQMFQWIIDLVLQYFTGTFSEHLCPFWSMTTPPYSLSLYWKGSIRISVFRIFIHFWSTEEKSQWVWNDERARKWWHIFGWAISLNTTTEQCKHVNQTDVKP